VTFASLTQSGGIQVKNKQIDSSYLNYPVKTPYMRYFERDNKNESVDDSLWWLF